MSRREEAEHDGIAHASDHGLDAVLVAAHVEERGAGLVRQPAIIISEERDAAPFQVVRRADAEVQTNFADVVVARRRRVCGGVRVGRPLVDRGRRRESVGGNAGNRSAPAARPRFRQSVE